MMTPIAQPVCLSERQQAQAARSPELLSRQPRRPFTERINQPPKAKGCQGRKASRKDGGRQHVQHAAEYAERCHVEQKKENPHHITQAGWARCGTGLTGVWSRQGPISVGGMVSLVLLFASPRPHGDPQGRTGTAAASAGLSCCPSAAGPRRNEGKTMTHPMCLFTVFRYIFLLKYREDNTDCPQTPAAPCRQSTDRISLRSRTLRTRPRSCPRRRICPSIATTA